jgi:type II secretory ATPase GspE/PulE/Tfp pilus assembly ATPase PilB-like protein
VRRVCENCRQPYAPNPDVLAAVAEHELIDASGPTPTMTHGAGCSSCRGTGFRGRLGIFELLVIDDAIREAIASRAPRAALHALASSAGFTPLRADGWNRARQGITTIEEVLRVVQD